MEVATGTWACTYYDGQSAAANDVNVQFADDALKFHDPAGMPIAWPYRRIHVERLAATARLTCKGEADAVLVLSGQSLTALEEAAPSLTADRQRRRRFASMVAGLTLAAAAVASLIFIVMPMAAGTLAQRTPISVEQQIGENLASQVQLFFRPCNEDSVEALVRPVVDNLASAAKIDYPVVLTLVRTDLANAFALPGGQTMATSGLLELLADDQEAFWAVVAHELAHVKNRDSMVALYRNLGLSTLLELVTGGSGAAQQLVLVGGQLNNLSYTREQERLADEMAYDILEEASLNPAALGRALDALVGAAPSNEAIVEERAEWRQWLESHPDTGKRIKRASLRARVGERPLPLKESEWAQVIAACDR